jgi:hypothetical protein
LLLKSLWISSSLLHRSGKTLFSEEKALTFMLMLF